MNEDVVAINNYLNFFGSNIRANVEIVTPVEIGRDYLFHISYDTKIKQFIPQVSRRTANNEDRSVPRISTAPTLVGCLSGYVASLHDWEDYGAGDKRWKGGWKIYAIPFDVALRPNKKILYDAEMTGEIWVVGYDKTHLSYPAITCGELFYTSVAKQTVGKGNRITKVEAYLCIDEGYELPINNGLILKSGYYQLIFNNFYVAMNLKSKQDITVKPLSSKEYHDIKKLDAGSLAFSIY